MSIKKYSRYLFILIPALFCAVVLILNQKQKIPVQQIPAVTEDDRSAWLLSQGWDGTLHSSRPVVIPDISDIPDSGNPGNSDNFNNFNKYIALQEMQNLPFAQYTDAHGIVYIYELNASDYDQSSENPVLYAELLTADGILVGAQCYHPGQDSETLDMQGKPVILN
ncbi:MAG: DUF4830 domain-containing protein [Oscillospiraceae bacterium]|nr:DUF4830 domain-containing protein [Oscillospiraceae bacterium]